LKDVESPNNLCCLLQVSGEVTLHGTRSITKGDPLEQVRDQIIDSDDLPRLLTFLDSSYGARPGRSAHQAIEEIRKGLPQCRHRAVDVDLSRYSDSIRHDRLLAKVAGRVIDDKVLAMVRQFLKSTGDRGVPRRSSLSPLLPNLALNELDRTLDRGGGFHTYVRYLDDMVVLTSDSEKGRRWADRALERHSS
jgi:retron-type reverse transcriptase